MIKNDCAAMNCINRFLIPVTNKIKNYIFIKSPDQENLVKSNKL